MTLSAKRVTDVARRIDGSSECFLILRGERIPLDSCDEDATGLGPGRRRMIFRVKEAAHEPTPEPVPEPPVEPDPVEETAEEAADPDNAVDEGDDDTPEVVKRGRGRPRKVA